MGQPDRVLRILIISDLETDRLLILNNLEALGHTLYSERVLSESEYKKKIDQSWNLVIFMSHVSFISPLSVLQDMKQNHPKLPCILISDGMGEEDVASFMKSGAEDVVITSRLHRLLPVVERVIREADTKKREIDALVVTHQAIASREQMLAIVSHDIRNPLSAIHLEAQMLLRVVARHGNSVMSEEIKIQANRILRTSERLKSLIHDLLDRNKTEDGLSILSKSPCELSGLFREVYESNRPLIKQKNILVRTSFSEEIMLEIDKNKIYQTLNNLVGNAIKYAPENGMIALSVEDHEHDYLFSILDNGPGLEETKLKKVFEKYWTADVPGKTGTGLGLFISKTIIEAHGGHIGGENLPEGGARFWFTLPKLKSEAKLTWVKDAKPKILVVDDDDDLRDVICWVLTQEGYDVHAYANPSEALDNIQLGRHEPKLIVVDFQMDQMTGTEFLKRLRLDSASLTGQCPVLMISATPEEIDEEEAKLLCNEIMNKPLDLCALVGNIKSYIS